MERIPIHAIRRVSCPPGGHNDKPLPNLPMEACLSTRQPGRPISGNSQRPINRIRSFFKLKPVSPQHDTQKVRRRKSITLEMQLRSPIRKLRKNDKRPQISLPDIDLLAKKVMSLESQLIEARHQLDFASESKRDRHTVRALNAPIALVGTPQSMHGARLHEMSAIETIRPLCANEPDDITPVEALNGLESKLLTGTDRNRGNMSAGLRSGNSRHRRTSSELNISVGELFTRPSSDMDVELESFTFPQAQHVGPPSADVTPVQLWRSANITVFGETDSEIDLDLDPTSPPPSPRRRHVPSPSKLHCVQEEYEWDEDVF